MPDLLAYRPSDSAMFYRPPSRVDVGRTVVGFTFAAVLVAAAAYLYGLGLPEVTALLPRLATVVVTAVVVGLLAGIPVRYGRVRVPVLAAAMGAVLASLAVYVMWLSWTHRVLLDHRVSIPAARLAIRPVPLLQFIVHLGRVGTWSYHGDTINGPALYLCWLIEAGLFLSAGTLIPTRMLYDSAPVCGDCGGRAQRVPDLPRFHGDTQAAVVSAVEGRSFAALVGLPPAPHADAPEVTVRLMSCRKCGHLNVLTVSRIAWHRNANRRLTVKTTKLLDGLLLTADEAARLTAACAQVRAERDAAAPPPLPDNRNA